MRRMITVMVIGLLGLCGMIAAQAQPLPSGKPAGVKTASTEEWAAVVIPISMAGGALLWWAMIGFGDTKAATNTGCGK